MNPLDTLVIRPGTPDDHARVFKDWLLSHATSDFARWLTARLDWQSRASQLYWAWQRDVIREALARAELWVASWGEDTSTIVGWCVLEHVARGSELSHIVHYVYVAHPFRASGVAKRLLAPALEESRVTYTHRTPVCRHLPIPPGWTFDPRPAVTPRPTKES